MDNFRSGTRATRTPAAANQIAAHSSWRVRLAFAFGQIPEGVQSTAFGFFLLYFYNQVLGLSGFLASTAIVVALVVDAVVDPIVGSLSDRTRGRWGAVILTCMAPRSRSHSASTCCSRRPASSASVGVFFWLLVVFDFDARDAVVLLDSTYRDDGGAHARIRRTDVVVGAALADRIGRHAARVSARSAGLLQSNGRVSERTAESRCVSDLRRRRSR